jgi:hypothetical protein
MIQMSFCHTDTTLWVFYTTGSSYKGEQYLPCLWGKETTQPAKDQRHRLVNYTQNATGNLPFNLKIY